MNPERRVDAFQHPARDHVERAPGVFLSRLEDAFHAAREYGPVFIENFRGGEQHRDVTVVPAGMHDALRAALIGNIILFLNRERVDIRAEKNGLSGPDPVDRDKSPRKLLAAGFPGDAGAGENGADPFSRVPLVPAELRGRVESAACPDHFLAIRVAKRIEVHLDALPRNFCVLSILTGREPDG